MNKNQKNNSNRPKKLVSSASKRAAARKLKELEDLKTTITDVISRSCPTLADDLELCQFLSEELAPYIDAISTKDDIFTLLEDHIKR
jgi:translation initiation factor 2 beta subunit (eIF-2beta)/eIF-5